LIDVMRITRFLRESSIHSSGQLMVARASPPRKS
jgi:hypothetical protein